MAESGNAVTDSSWTEGEESREIGDVISDWGDTSLESNEESVKACGAGAETGAGEIKGRAAG